MSFWSFTIWFIGALVLISSIDILMNNSFITAFVAAIVIGFLGAREDG